MRDDFAKQLVERERIHSRDHYHNYRNVRGPKGAWGDDEVGGRESMRVRYNHGYDRKSFNENLNPLRGWLRSCLGKKWDKCYSELRTKFDARSVVNNHILEHLWQDVETNTYVGEKGAVMFMDTRYTNKGEQPIKNCYKDYYVCPKDGTLKKTRKAPRRSVVKQREAEKKAKELETCRFLDAHNVLRLVDGVWYHFELRPIPKVRIEYVKPAGVDIFKTGYQYLGTANSRREKTWDELNETERKRHGVATVIGQKGRDLFTGHLVYEDQHGNRFVGQQWMSSRQVKHGAAANTYHATKKSANRKQLKQAGLA